ncbi:MAG: amidohydrolase [Clostridiales bacterium]|jgi:amidohydrolase|nr:amidohydrolase [Clostridiales bacterium]
MDMSVHLTRWRRELHTIPELANCEFKTQSYLLAELKAMGVCADKCGTGLVVDVRGERRERVALRADMDALPVTECADKPYASTHDGMMHACGHDAHMAMLLAAVRIAKETRPKYTVRFIFQPAEENVGGAEGMIAAGCLKGVGRIYGLHVAPDIPAGTIATDGGGILAGTVEYTIDFHGRSVHCAVRDTGIDALAAACSFHVRAERLYRDKYARNCLHHIGVLRGGTASNIVAESARLECTFRYFDDAHKEAFFVELAGVLSALGRETGADHKLTVNSLYPPLVNDPALAAAVKRLGNAVPAAPRYTAEDFAYYLNLVPGVFAWLGVGDQTHNAPLHSPGFDLDERALLTGVDYWRWVMNT